MCFTRVLTALLLGLVVVQVSTTNAQPASELDGQLDERLEEAILAEDWEKVVSMLPKDDEWNLPATLRLVKGHACLATNRNNESLCLFLSATSKEELQEWQEWSQDFATKYPASPIAHYFKGDSYARLEQWNLAISNFNIALKMDPNHPLVLNARGVAYANKNELAKARVDFQKAISTSDGQLSDAYANIGVLRIQKKSGIKGALRAFDKALEISPNFAIALHGKACLKVANANEITEAEKKSLVAAVKDCPSDLLKKLMLANAQRIKAFWEGRETEYFLAMLGSGEEVGTTVNSNISALSPGNPIKSYAEDILNGVGHFEPLRNQLHANNAIKGLTHLSPTIQAQYVNEAQDMLSKHGYGDNMPKNFGHIESYNASDGPAKNFNLGVGLIGGAAATYGADPITKGVGIGLIGGAAKMNNITDRNRGVASDVMDIINSNGTLNTPLNMPVGGVDMNLADVHQGPGMWPFVGYYALGYDLAKFEQPFAYVHGLDSSRTNEPMKTGDGGTTSSTETHKLGDI